MFSIPNELTLETTKACNMLADCGIPLGSQTVLLKGVNDDIEIMKNLEIASAVIAYRFAGWY
jgi:lysine 2,3-aminomutase